MWKGISRCGEIVGPSFMDVFLMYQMYFLDTPSLSSVLACTGLSLKKPFPAKSSEEPFSSNRLCRHPESISVQNPQEMSFKYFGLASLNNLVLCGHHQAAAGCCTLQCWWPALAGRRCCCAFSLLSCTAQPGDREQMLPSSWSSGKLSFEHKQDWLLPQPI